MTYFLGVDPGLSGAYSVISDTDVIHCEDFSKVRPAKFLRGHPKITLAVLEKVGARPEQDVRGAWKFAQNYGYWIGLLEAFQIPYLLISPQQWMNQILDSEARGARKKVTRKGVEGLARDKSSSVRFINQMYPELELPKSADGRAEAICIAMFGRKYHHSSSLGASSVKS